VTGGRLELLRGVRDNLAGRIEAASDRDVAGLVRQLTDVLSQIEALETAAAPVKGTPLDELRARRAGRRADPVGGERPAVPGV